MKIKFYFLTVLSIVFCRMEAQVVPTALANALQDTLSDMHAVLGNKGMGAAVMLPDGSVWEGATGISSTFPAGNISINHTFLIGSVTKTITSACILKMVDEGLLSLTDSLHEWIEPIQHVNPNITIRQLLRHQSGLYDVVPDQALGQAIFLNQDSMWQFRDVITTFIKPPLSAPGGAWNYCNTNFLLLGMIIEAASGQSYHEAIRTRFWTPLQLNSCLLPTVEPYNQPVAHVWLYLNADNVLDDAHYLFSNWTAWFSTAAPAGGFFSDAGDMARWMRSLMEGELFSPEMMVQMKNTIITGQPESQKYGLGIMERTIGGLKAWGHAGDAGYSASVWYFPSEDISIAVLNNDGSKNSWTLSPTVAALLKKYQQVEAQTSSVTTANADASVRIASANPFSDQLSVALENADAWGTVQMSLYDVLGRVVAQHNERPDGVCTLQHLSHLPAGAYVLRLQGEKPTTHWSQVVLKQ
jgi:CubicO group peptidase (beta-lactamase class C family)